MNPQKSLMAFLVLLLLSGSAAAGTDSQWIPIKGGQDVYYLPKAAYDRVVANGGGSRDLYLEPRTGQAAATLEVEIVQGQARLTVIPKAGGAKVPGALIEEAAAPVPAEALMSAPPKDMDGCLKKGVEPNICEMVLKSPSLAGAPAALRIEVAQDFQRFRSKNLMAFAEIYAGKADRNDAFTDAANAILASQGDEGARAGAAFKSFLRSAAPRAASAAPAPAPLAAAPPAIPKPEGQPVRGGMQAQGAKTPFDLEIAELAKLLAQRNSAARRGALDRVAGYLLSPREESKAFFAVSKDVPQERRAAFARQFKEEVKVRVPPLVKKWVEQKADDAEGSKELATLYIALGEDDAKAAAFAGGAKTRLLKLLAQQETGRRALFDKRMELWTSEEAKARQDNQGLFYQGPFTSLPAPNPPPGQHALDDILKDMVHHAQESLIAAGMKDDELLGRINKGLPGAGGNPGGVPNVPVEPGTGQPGGVNPPGPVVPIPAGDLKFGFNALYVNGAVLVKVPLYGQEKSTGDECCRTLSLKIYTSIDEKGQAVNELGIFDISDAGGGKPGIYGRRFPIPDGDATNADALPFTLKEGGLDYNLSITNGQIAFGRGDGKTGAYAAPSPSVRELLNLRAKEVQELGQTTVVGDKKYRVLGQGGKYGTFLYYPADASGPALDKPAILVSVNRLGAGGLPEPLEGKLKMQNNAAVQKEPVGYFLQWNKDVKKLELQKGEGDVTAKEIESKEALEKAKSKKVAEIKETAKGLRDKVNALKKKAGDGEEKSEGEGGAAAEGSLSKDCGIAEEPEHETHKLESGWTVFVNKAQEAPSFRLCYKSKQIYQNGLVVKDGIREEDGFLVLEVAEANAYIPLDQLDKDRQITKQNIASKEFLFKNKLSGRRKLYYIAADNFNEAAISKAWDAKKEDGRSLVCGQSIAECLSSFALGYGKIDKAGKGKESVQEITVYVRDSAAAEEAKDNAAAYLAKYGEGSKLLYYHDHSPKDKEKFQAYIQGVVGNAENLGPNSHFTMNLNWKTEDRLNQAVLPSWDKSDILFYCRSGKKGEKGVFLGTAPECAGKPAESNP